MPDTHRAFVFHDPTGKRWQRFRRSLQTGAIFLGILLVLFVLSMAISPQIPALGLPSVEHIPGLQDVPAIIHGERPARNVPFKLRKAARNIKYVRSVSPVLHPKTAARVKIDSPIVFGFYVNWDPASMVSLRMHLAHLTHLVPEWLILRNAQGDLEDESDPTVIAIAAQAKLPIIALVTNYRDGWQAGDVRKILHDADARADLVDNIYSNLAEHHFAGVNIDFEELTPRDRDPFLAFMRQLRAKLAPANLLLTESVPVDDPAYDLKQLAAINDYIVPMVYDEHYQSGEPGPIASEDWFQKEIDRLGRIAPPAKMVIGIGNYGYDWTIGGSGVRGDEVRRGDVAGGIQTGAGRWDANMANPVFRYQAGGRQHEVWFLDAVTALNAGARRGGRRLPRRRAVAIGRRRSGLMECARTRRLARRQLRSAKAIRAGRREIGGAVWRWRCAAHRANAARGQPQSLARCGRPLCGTVWTDAVILYDRIERRMRTARCCA